MSRHEGVSCDSCLTGNFRGRRYKCLVCYDYDLCSNCFESGAVTTRHSNTHAMQCILTRADHDLFYGGEISGHSSSSSHPLSVAGSSESIMSYTCPYCAKLGFTEATLIDHVTSQHSESGQEVVCPICAALPGGDPNHLTSDFASHLTIEHRSGPRDLISFLESPGSNGGGRDSSTGSITRPLGVRRVPHTARGTSRARRAANVHNPNLPSSALSSLSPSTGISSRDNVDPIAELLSQLSGVRRSAAGGASLSSSSQLHQLQMQLHVERQQASQQRNADHRSAPRSRSSYVFGRTASSTANPSNGPSSLGGIFTNSELSGASAASTMVSMQQQSNSAPHQDNQAGSANFNDNANTGTGKCGSEIYLLRQNSDEEADERAAKLDSGFKQQKGRFLQEIVLSTLLGGNLRLADNDNSDGSDNDNI